MKSKVLIKLSAVIDKVGIDVDDIKVIAKDSSDKSQAIAKKQLGEKLLIKLVRSLHKAEKETYDLVAAYKDCSVKQAEDEDIIEIIKEVLTDGDVKDFFS